MISVYVGKPRSGKSYKAVSDIVDQFIGGDFIGKGGRLEDDKYDYLYTNIKGLKFDEINDYLEITGAIRRIRRLDWKIFYHHLQKLYELAQKDVEDEELVEYLKRYQLHKVLFVDDEAHMHFPDSTRDPVLVWFLGYHGHMGFDIWLLSQSLKKLNAKYYEDCEDFIEAQPAKKTLSENHLRYMCYVDSDLKKPNRYETIDLLKNPKIYRLYKSGDMHKPKKILHKYLGMVGFLFLATVGLFYFFLSHFAGNADNAAHDLRDANQYAQYVSSSYGDSQLFQMNCDESRCWNGSEKFRPVSYPLDVVYAVLERNNFEVIAKNIVASVDGLRQPATPPRYKIEAYYVFVSMDDLKRLLPDLFIPYEDESPKSIIKSIQEKKDDESII